MATVSSTLKLNDKMTPALKSIMTAMNSTLRAMEGMDVASSSAFRAAKRDAAIASSAIDDFANSFDKIPDSAQRAERSAGSGLDNLIKKAVALTAAVYGVRKAFDLAGKVINISDQLTQSTARLGILSEQMPSIALSFDTSGAEGQADKLTALQEQVFASAQRSRSGYFDTMNAVSQLGMNAGDAFSSTDEIVAFSELMNKSFKVSGADAQAQAGAMRQLTQALASGVLRGDEFNSIAEQAPMVYQAIADYMGKSKGEIRAMAADGALSAAVVKNAMFAAAEDIENKFTTMPKTFSDQWTIMKNDALQAFTPLLTTLNQMLNSPEAQTALSSITNGFYLIADGAQWALGLISQGAQWAYGNLDQLKTALILLGAVTIGVAGASAVSWAIANWPILLIIGSIVLLTGILNHFGVSSEQVLGVVAGLFGGLYAFLYNMVSGTYNLFVSFAEFFANFLNDPVGSIYRLFWNLQDFILSTLQIIASGIDAVFGSNLAGVVSGWREGLEAKVTATFGEPEVKFDRMGQMDILDGWNKGLSVAGNITDGLSNAAERIAEMGTGDMDYSPFGDDISEIGKVGSVGRIDDDVSISEEDIKLLKDVVALDWQMNLTQLTPQMSVQFGDVRETADVGAILEFIEEITEEALSSSLVVNT